MPMTGRSLTIFSRVGNRTTSLMEAIWDVDANFKTEEEKFKHLDDTIVKHENIVRALEVRNQESS